MADDAETTRALERREEARQRRKRRAKREPRAEPPLELESAPPGELNPYAPPRTREIVEPAPSSLEDASKGQRFGNLVIDRIVLVPVEAGLGVVIGTDPITSIAANLAIWLLYYTLCEGLFGRTLGKLLTGTRVVRDDGSPITMGTAFYRTLVRIVPFEPFSFFGAYPTGWHDRWTHTRVVKIR